MSATVDFFRRSQSKKKTRIRLDIKRDIRIPPSITMPNFNTIKPTAVNALNFKQTESNRKITCIYPKR